jgi:hypothetical protein
MSKVEVRKYTGTECEYDYPQIADLNDLMTRPQL